MSECCEMPDHNPSGESIRKLLREAKRIAIVGLSDKPDRDSHMVARYLQRQGYEIIPVNPVLKGEVLGARVYASLAEVPGPIDIVDVFRRAEAVPAIVKEAIAVKARAVWMQAGIAHNEAAREAEAAGLEVVQSKCIKVEHAMLLG